LLAWFTLTGCIRIDADLTLDDYETVSGTVKVAYTEQALMAITNATDWTREDFLETDRTDFLAAMNLPPEQVKIDRWDGVGEAGYTFVFTKAPLYTVLDALPVVTLSTESKDNKLTINGKLDPAEYIAGDYSDIPGLDEEFQKMTIQLAVTFPGKVSDTNGTVAGKKVSWTATVGQPVSFKATATTGSPSWMAPLIGAIAVILAGAISGLIAKRTKKKNQASPAMASGDLAAPPPGTPFPSGAPTGEPARDVGPSSPQPYALGDASPLDSGTDQPPGDNSQTS